MWWRPHEQPARQPVAVAATAPPQAVRPRLVRQEALAQLFKQLNLWQKVICRAPQGSMQRNSFVQYRTELYKKQGPEEISEVFLLYKASSDS